MFPGPLDRPVRTDLSRLVLAHFRPEGEPGGEQIRLAVSQDRSPLSWVPLAGGEPVVVADVGEGGARDPFLLRDERRGRFVLLATDLRIGSDDDWERATHWGSRSILVWESPDLVEWTPTRRIEVAPTDAGNAWAPKAFWSEERDEWVIVFASAIYPDQAREGFRHQRLLMVTTRDFETVSEPEVYFDPGHDVIDATFAHEDGVCYRFSANTHGTQPGVGAHVFVERGSSLLGRDFSPVAVDVGRESMPHGEGPAVFPALDRRGWYLLIDDIDGIGYHVFFAARLSDGKWTECAGARFPSRARHGSVLAISEAEHLHLTREDDAFSVETTRAAPPSID